MIILRCRHTSANHRCQLLAGHETDHAAMTSIGKQRRLWVWSRSAAGTQPNGAVQPIDRASAFPWASGYPAVEASISDLSGIGPGRQRSHPTATRSVAS